MCRCVMRRCPRHTRTKRRVARAAFDTSLRTACPMSVLLDTSLGEIVIDLLVDDAPIACLNFLKLCKIKYYSQHIFHFIERDLLIQAGDPSRTGRGGSSVFGLLGGAKLFQDEVKKSVRHDKAGTVSMANSGPDSNGSQFFILARDGCDYLDGKRPSASCSLRCSIVWHSPPPTVPLLQASTLFLDTWPRA